MSKKKKHKHKQAVRPPRSVTFQGSVLQSIRQHARSSPHAEICGALIGRQSETGTVVVGAVAGEGAAQGGAHVTFTQEAWVRIHEEKERKYSGQAIVGWYHSHPGFGVFLSDHDIFIHKHFFSTPGSLAWVYDPHSDEEGCFGWNAGEVRRLDRFGVVFDVSKDTGPRTEPSPSTSTDNAKHIPRFPAWCSPKMRRVLLISGLIVLCALFIALGEFVLRRSSLPERVHEWLKQQHIDRPAATDIQKSPERAREVDEVGRKSTDGSADSVPTERDDNRRNRDGGRDEQ